MRCADFQGTRLPKMRALGRPAGPRRILNGLTTFSASRYSTCRRAGRTLTPEQPLEAGELFDRLPRLLNVGQRSAGLRLDALAGADAWKGGPRDAGSPGRLHYRHSERPRVGGPSAEPKNYFCGRSTRARYGV